MKLRLLFLTFLFSALSWGQVVIDNTATGAAIPAGWSSTNAVTSQAIQQGGYYLVQSTTAPLNDYLFSDIYTTLNGASSIIIDFQIATYGSGTNSPLYVDISLNGGSTWSSTQISGATPTSSSYVTTSVTFPGPIASSNVQFRFYDGVLGDKGVRIRNIVISAFVPTTHSVTYDGNGNNSGSVPIDGNAYSSGDSVTVLGNTGSLGLSGFVFNGWNTAADGSGTSYVASDTFTITANTTLYAQWLNTSPPVITSSLTDSGTVGAAYTYNIVATNSPTSYSATGLPAGLSINTSTGEITGSPTGTGVFNVTISATNAYGTDTETLVITITTGPCLSEDFSAMSGWTDNGTSSDSVSGHFGASAPCRALGTGDNIISPSVSNPNQLVFFQDASSGGSGSTATVEYSTNGGSTWLPLYSFNVSSSGNTEVVDLTNISGVDLSTFSNVIFRFNSSFNTWYLDDVEVYCGISCTPPANPVGTISGVTPACATTTLSYSETAVAPVEFYWQTTSLGTSTTNNASSPLVVTTSGDYYVRAFNTATSCWSVAEVGPYAVVISSAATITSQPANASAVENGGASFTVATTGTGLSYQWQVNTGSGFVNITDGIQYSGSNTASLTISNATLVMDGYVYQCVVSSACGNVMSNSATLSVIAATGTTFNPGELVFVGYDGQFEGSGADDEYLIATLVDLIPGTTFSLVNSRFEAGAPANVRTNKWGGGGDLAEEAPYVVELSYNGSTIIPAGSVLRFETNNGPFWFGRVDVTVGTTTTNRTSDFSGNLVSGVPNISTSGADQMFLIQGSFTFDGSLDLNEANYYLSGTLLHGITNRAAWVPLTDACNGDDSGGNSRESRLPNELTCFNVENASTSNISAYYENDKEHGLATIRQIVLALSDVNNNWTLGTGRYTIDPTSSSSTRAGKTFLIGASNPPGQWVGNVNTNWFDCANWEGLAVPKLTTNVTISSSSVRDAQVDYTAQYSDLYSDIAVCNDITISDRKLIVEGNANNVLNVYGDLVISATGAVDMDDSNNGTADGTIHLYGDWTNNVDETAFEEGNGTIHFDGTVAQIISNVAPEGTEIFYDVVMNNDFSTNISNNLIATGDLVVTSGKTITVDSNDFIQVNHDLTNNGIFNVLDDGSLIQVDDSGVNTGDISYERITTGNNLDYVYWSSPVEGVNTPATGHIYIWDADFANPNNGWGYWLLARNTTMAPGVGYIMRNIFNRTFTGVPRNGVIQPSISRANYTGADFLGANNVTITYKDDNWNLVGNPYPSAISAVDFLDANPNIEGAVRIWTHGTSPAVTTQPVYDSFVYNYTVSDYIVFNATGSQTGPDTFNGFIAGGQSFMINMNDGAAATETVTFNNAMRNRAHNNEQFYKQASPSNKSIAATEKHRIWLDLANAENNSTRTLVGYITDATNGKDRLFDAVTNAQANEMGIYSIINDERMLIQGRTLPFDNQDKVQLAVNIPSSGTYSIGLSALDGLFNGSQDIYLEDLTLGIIHDLRVMPYSFQTQKGEFKNRFVLRYTNETLSEEEVVSSNDIIIATLQNGFNIVSNKQKIKSVTIHNVLGQIVFERKNVNSTEIHISELMKNNQALIVKITLDNNIEITKKVIF